MYVQPCSRDRSGNLNSKPIGETHRSNATCRRTEYDIHNLFNVLCFLLLFTIAPVLPCPGPGPRILGALHHVLLSLFTRSRISPKRLHDLDPSCDGTWHICHGNCLAAFSEDARITAPRRWSERNHDGTSEVHSPIRRSPRCQNSCHHVVHDRMRHFDVHRRVFYLVFRQPPLLYVSEVEKNGWPSVGSLLGRSRMVVRSSSFSSPDSFEEPGIG